jgi:hypothetical protein
MGFQGPSGPPRYYHGLCMDGQPVLGMKTDLYPEARVLNVRSDRNKRGARGVPLERCGCAPQRVMLHIGMDQIFAAVYSRRYAEQSPAGPKLPDSPSSVLFLDVKVILTTRLGAAALTLGLASRSRSLSYIASSALGLVSLSPLRIAIMLCGAILT